MKDQFKSKYLFIPSKKKTYKEYLLASICFLFANSIQAQSAEPVPLSKFCGQLTLEQNSILTNDYFLQTGTTRYYILPSPLTEGIDPLGQKACVIGFLSLDQETPSIHALELKVFETK